MNHSQHQAAESNVRDRLENRVSYISITISLRGRRVTVIVKTRLLLDRGVSRLWFRGRMDGPKQGLATVFQGLRAEQVHCDLLIAEENGI